MTVAFHGWLAHRATALLVTALILLPVGRAFAAEGAVVINQVAIEQFPEVVAYLTVVDGAGLPVADLAQDRVRVLHNGDPIPDFTLGAVDATQDGLAVVVAVDTSGSMRGAPLDRAREAVGLLLDRMGPRDRGAIISFGQSVQVVQDLTDDREALRRAADALAAGGDTALYDGAFQAIELAAGNPLGRRAVVLITDGEDTHSRRALDEVIARARETTTPVSAIGFGEVMVEALQRLTAQTGGLLSIAPDADRLGERAGQTAELLRRQYVVRYRAPDSRPPENALEIVVALGDGQPEARAAQTFPAPPMPPLGVGLADLEPGATVRGQVALRPVLTNATRVDAVEYLLDGAPLQTVAEPPYAFTWDAAGVPPGQHTVSVRARLGEQAAQHDLALTVAPAVEVRIIAPPEEAGAGPVTLTAEVAAGAAVQSVAWAVDGRPIGTVQQPPYAVAWDPAGAAPGEHVVSAEARDERGNVGRASQAVRVATAPGAASPIAGPAPAGQGAASPVAGSPGPAGGSAGGGTPTLVPTRAPTATPLPTEESGPGGIAWAIWIGGGVLLALAVAVLVATARRRPAATVVAASSTPAPDSGSLPRPLGMAGDRPAPPAVSGAPSGAGADLREAETMLVGAPPSLIAGASPAATGALGHSVVVVRVQGAPPRTYPLGIDQMVGRQPGPGIIVVTDPLVSRRHARITWEEGHFVYRDLGPLNPTRRDGRAVPNPYILRDGDCLRVGHSELAFRA